MREILFGPPKVDDGNHKVAFSDIFSHSSHLVLQAFPDRCPFEYLMPINSTRQTTKVLFRKGGASHPETLTSKEHVSVPKYWFDAMKTNIRELEVITHLKVTKETAEFRKSMITIEAQLQAVKDKNDSLGREVSFLSSLRTTCSVKSKNFEPKGKSYNLVPQITSNYESYQKLPTGVKGHMVVVLDTAFYAKTCRVWAVTVSTSHLPDIL